MLALVIHQLQHNATLCIIKLTVHVVYLHIFFSYTLKNYVQQSILLVVTIRQGRLSA